MLIKKYPYVVNLYLITYILMYNYVEINDNITLNYKNKDRIWTLYTYSLVHYNLSHLIENISLFIPLGVLIEIYKGHIFIFLVFSISQIFGGLYASFNKCNMYYLGSSAGVYGLHGILYGLLFEDNLPKMIKIFCIICPSISIFTYIYFTITSTNLKTCHLCHIGGFISGFLLTLLNNKKYGIYGLITNILNISMCYINYMLVDC